MNSFLYKNISTAATTAVCPKPCILHSIIVNATAAGTITVNDGDTTVATLKASIAENTYCYNVNINKSLEIVTAGASNITVSYKPSA